MVDSVPTPQEARAQAAYREALLRDDGGREARRARLMAALPRPDTAAPSVVAAHALAERASPWGAKWVWALVATGLLLTALVARLKGGGTGAPAGPDPRLVAAASAPAAPSAPGTVVVAQVEPAQAPTVAARRAPPVAVAQVAPRRHPAARSEPPASVVVADTTPSPAGRMAASAGTEPTATPPAAPAAAAPAAPVAAAPAAPVAAAPAMPEPLAEHSNAWSARAKASSVANSLAASPIMPAAAGSGVQADTTTLLQAAARGDVASARAALRAGVPVHARDRQGRTALMLGARAGSRELVVLLLSAGARPADRDANGWRATDHALDQGHAGLLDLLPPD